MGNTPGWVATGWVHWDQDGWPLVGWSQGLPLAVDPSSTPAGGLTSASPVHKDSARERTATEASGRASCSSGDHILAAERGKVVVHLAGGRGTSRCKLEAAGYETVSGTGSSALHMRTVRQTAPAPVRPVQPSVYTQPPPAVAVGPPVRWSCSDSYISDSWAVRTVG